MAGSGRWIRLDVNWDDSAWLADLPWPVRAVWPLILAHVKTMGSGGVCEAPNMRRFCAAHDVPQECVEAFLDGAHRAGAMNVEGSEWTVVKWRTYQESDSAERMRRMRLRNNPSPEEAAQHEASQPEQDEEVTNTGACDVTARNVTSPCHATETETETESYALSISAAPPVPEREPLGSTGPPGRTGPEPAKPPPAWWPDRYPESRFPTPEAWWDEFSRAFPRRAGDSKLKLGAELARRLLREGRGDLEERILAGAKRYRDWCEATGKLRTEFVQQVPTWLRNRGWEEPWEIPPDVPAKPVKPRVGPGKGNSWRSDLGISA